MYATVSVVIPVWNGEKAGRGYLRQSIHSLVTQDYEGPIEIVVVDDGSTDETPRILRDMESSINEQFKSRKLVVSRRPHEGVTRSLNHGLRVASGKFIARQDADDWSDENRIRTQVQYLEDHPDVAMVGSAVRVVRYRKVKDEVWYRASGVSKNSFRDGSPFAHGSVMFRTEHLREVGEYDVRYLHAQDYDFFWRIAKKYKVSTIPEALYFYRVHDNRVTSDRKRFQIQLGAFKNIRQKIRRELKRL